MGKVMNYIEGGKGSGLKYFLIFSLIFTVILSSTLGYVMLSVTKNDPVLNDFIDRMPAIVIKDGKVVEPENSFVVVPFVNGQRDVFVLNTTDTVPTQLGFDNGIYMTKDTVYLKTAAKVEQFSLTQTGDIALTHDTLRQMLKKAVIIVTCIIVAFLFIMLWIAFGLVYLLLSLFFLILGRPTCPRVKGRTVFLSLSTVAMLDFILLLFGYAFSIPVIITITLVLAIFIIFKTRPCSMPVEESLMAVEAESHSKVDETGEKIIMPAMEKSNSKKTSKTKQAAKKTTVKSVKSVSKPGVKKTVKKTAVQTASGKKTSTKKTSHK